MSLFCLVHGSTQSAEGWKLLISELEKRGHLTVTMNLPTNEPQSSATRYADVIVQTLDQTNHDPGDVVVVAHSASGMFLPLVAARRPIGHLVFLAALIPKIGASILDQFKVDPDMFKPEWVGKNPMDDEVARKFLFHDCAPDIVEWALKTRRLMHAKQAMSEICPLKTWPEVSCSSVVCKDERVLSPSWSRRVAKERLGIEPIELDGGHCPYVSRPSALADVLTSAPIIKSHPKTITTEEFRILMKTVADGWNEGNARKAADCYTEDAIYIEPPDKQVYRGRTALYEFFGGDKRPEPPMKMVWHHLAFDEKDQVGFGEYTFQMNNRYHGIVVVKIETGKIKSWREYQYKSGLEWEEFTKNNRF